MANPAGCYAQHEDMKRDRATWESLPLLDVHKVAARPDRPAYALELRNCTRCNSTLAIRLEVTP